MFLDGAGRMADDCTELRGELVGGHGARTGYENGRQEVTEPMVQQTIPPKRARALIVDGSPAVREMVRNALSNRPNFVVVGELASPGLAAQATQELAPDLVFLGLRRDGTGGSALRAMRRTVELAPLARLIVIAEGRDCDIAEAVLAGARAVLCWGVPAQLVLEAAAVVLAGGAVLDPRLTGRLFEGLAGARAVAGDGEGPRLNGAALRALSRREQEVLRLLARGRRNKEIALQLGVSVGTVKTHLRHIFRKLKVADRTSAVLTALDQNLAQAA